MAEQIIMKITQPDEQIVLNRDMKGKTYRVRWVKVTGATGFPAESVFFISGDSANDSSFGVMHVSNVTRIGSSRCLAVPLSAQTFVIDLDEHLVIDNRGDGMSLDQNSHSTWNMRVTSDLSTSPVFTSIVICLETHVSGHM